MRRRVSLYIVDRLVDLDDGSFILFNWAQEDLSNPTVVKNSYTQQITLKGTPLLHRGCAKNESTSELAADTSSQYNYRDCLEKVSFLFSHNGPGVAHES